MRDSDVPKSSSNWGDTEKGDIIAAELRVMGLATEKTGNGWEQGYF